jgi:hypothetical protein
MVITRFKRNNDTHSRNGFFDYNYKPKGSNLAGGGSVARKERIRVNPVPGNKASELFSLIP